MYRIERYDVKTHWRSQTVYLSLDQTTQNCSRTTLSARVFGLLCLSARATFVVSYVKWGLVHRVLFRIFLFLDVTSMCALSLSHPLMVAPYFWHSLHYYKHRRDSAMPTILHAHPGDHLMLNRDRKFCFVYQQMYIVTRNNTWAMTLENESLPIQPNETSQHWRFYFSPRQSKTKSRGCKRWEGWGVLLANGCCCSGR